MKQTETLKIADRDPLVCEKEESLREERGQSTQESVWTCERVPGLIAKNTLHIHIKGETLLRSHLEVLEFEARPNGTKKEHPWLRFQPGSWVRFRSQTTVFHDGHVHQSESLIEKKLEALAMNSKEVMCVLTKIQTQDGANSTELCYWTSEEIPGHFARSTLKVQGASKLEQEDRVLEFGGQRIREESRHPWADFAVGAWTRRAVHSRVPDGESQAPRYLGHFLSRRNDEWVEIIVKTQEGEGEDIELQKIPI